MRILLQKENEQDQLHIFQDIYILIVVKCISYNNGHNILRIFDILRNSPVTANEIKHDY